MKMALLLVGSAVLFFLGGAAYDLYIEQPPRLIEGGMVSDPSDWKLTPDFQVTDLQGKIIRISDLRGKPVILSFWATWCTPCKVEFPLMLNYIKSRRGDVVLLALASDESNEIVQRFLDKLEPDSRKTIVEPNVYIALDRDRSITRGVFLTDRYPETIFIRADGKMARKVVGLTDWNDLGKVTAGWLD